MAKDPKNWKDRGDWGSSNGGSSSGKSKLGAFIGLVVFGPPVLVGLVVAGWLAHGYGLV